MLFNEIGYEATTFQKVADRSHLTRPAINHYFTTKAALYQAVVAQIQQDIIAVGLGEAHAARRLGRLTFATLAP